PWVVEGRGVGRRRKIQRADPFTDLSAGAVVPWVVEGRGVGRRRKIQRAGFFSELATPAAGTE
ncbi:MAG: hypothetical protein ACODAU_04800, partial [Myxococcota bacterium]